MRDGTAIELALHPADERLHRLCIRTPHSGRRHHPGAQLPDNLFSDFLVVRKMCQVELVQQEVRRLEPGVVTHHAVLVEQRAARRNFCGIGRRLRLRGRLRPRDRARLKLGWPRRLSRLARNQGHRHHGGAAAKQYFVGQSFPPWLAP